MSEYTVFEKILARLKNNRFIAILLVLGVLVIALATIIDSFLKIAQPLRPNTKVYLDSSLKPFTGGVVELKIPEQFKTNGNLMVEAVLAPKNREHSEYRNYDVFLRNTSNQPITLIAVIVDSEAVPALGAPKQSGDRGPAYPEVAYELMYKLYAKEQRLPLTNPYRITAEGTGAFRIHLEPFEESKEKSASRALGLHVMSLRLVDSNEAKTLIISHDPGRHSF